MFARTLLSLAGFAGFLSSPAPFPSPSPVAPPPIHTPSSMPVEPSFSSPLNIPPSPASEQPRARPGAVPIRSLHIPPKSDDEWANVVFPPPTSTPTLAAASPFPTASPSPSSSSSPLDVAAPRCSSSRALVVADNVPKSQLRWMALKDSVFPYTLVFRPAVPVVVFLLQLVKARISAMLLDPTEYMTSILSLATMAVDVDVFQLAYFIGMSISFSLLARFDFPMDVFRAAGRDLHDMVETPRPHVPERASFIRPATLVVESASAITQMPADLSLGLFFMMGTLTCFAVRSSQAVQAELVVDTAAADLVSQPVVEIVDVKPVIEIADVKPVIAAPSQASRLRPRRKTKAVPASTRITRSQSRASSSGPTTRSQARLSRAASTD